MTIKWGSKLPILLVFLICVVISFVKGFLHSPICHNSVLRQQSPPSRIGLTKPYYPTATNRQQKDFHRLHSADFFSAIDQNHDGHLSLMEIMEAPVTVFKHSPLIQNYMKSLQKFYYTSNPTSSLADATLNAARVKGVGISSLWHDITTLVHFSDLAGIAACLILYKPFLRMIYKMIHSDLPNVLSKALNGKGTSNQTIDDGFYHEKPTFEKSFIGQMQTPISFFLWFPAFLYTIDVLSLILAHAGFDFHIKGDLPRLLCTVAYSIITGSFVTKLKDWILHKLRVHSIQNHYGRTSVEVIKHLERQSDKDKLFDELTSFAIWVIVGFTCIQAFSLEYGIALKSIFAIGGISSASFVWAWRSTMENIVGGILLKLQDKFHVGDRISVPAIKKDNMYISNGDGIVEEIHYVTTKLRCADDSVMIIPNALFIQGQVVNWSRTPYRLFTTTITLKYKDIGLLPFLIERLKTVLAKDEGIEEEKRDLIVSATGFEGNGDVKVEIRASLRGNTEQDLSEIKTRIVNTIAKTMDAVILK